MSASDRASTSPWPVWQRVLFRFFFVYLLLQIAPLNWLGRIPGLNLLTTWYYVAVDWAVRAGNAALFHVRDPLVPVNGSGDTSWGWAQLWLYLSLAAVSCIIWSVLDRSRPNYDRLAYWLRTIVRYYIATFALSYGIIKIFALQMYFPTLSQLATPLGDFLPMRFSWLFIGYSTKYQVFSGIMETVAGLLLLFRRTVTLGLFAATGAFINVVMINMSYDVPVKLFASHLLFACVFLLVLDAKRLMTFLVFNRAAPATNAYEPPFTQPWQHVARLVAKGTLVVLILILPFKDSYGRWQALRHEPPAEPFRVGVYDVQHYVVNGDTIPPLVADSLRWRDVIFDNVSGGSVGTADTVFWQRYRRGYFRFKADTTRRTVAVWKTNTAFDSTYLFDMRYELADTTGIRLWTKIRADSIFVDLRRTNRHFQLAERQFHWLSEYNR
ncbi:MAG: hypothetical protein U0132_14085 [Gemmatimonadaceae bacterium]